MTLSARIIFILSTLLLAHIVEAKLQVFILAGQSNMEGAGVIKINPNSKNGGKGTLEYLTRNKGTRKEFAHLVDKEGKWVARKDVFIRYGERSGNLKAGFGARSSAIGPELGFGQVIGDALDEPVLLIKTCWGGKSIFIDFRPPSSGMPPKETLDKMLNGARKKNADASMEDVKTRVGHFYRLMLSEVEDTLGNLEQYVPEHDGKGYEIAGFAWHQGWNDGLSHVPVAEYAENLANLIKDIRKEWTTPSLPVAIAVSGVGGRNQKSDRRLGIIEAQHAIAMRREFKGTATSVETRDFWRPREDSPGGQGYHWNNNAETYYRIGEGLGKAMVKLLK